MTNKFIYDKVNALVTKYKTRDPKELIDAFGIIVLPINSPEKLLGAYLIILKNRMIFSANNIGFLEKLF